MEGNEVPATPRNCVPEDDTLARANAAKLAGLRELQMTELKQTLSKILQQRDETPIFTLRDDGNSKAKCWTKFRHVYEKKKGIKALNNRFVFCNTCAKVFAYIPSNGTRTLNEHMKKCSSAPKISGSLVQYLAKAEISTADKKRVTKAVARMCCLDLRPFNIVSGDGFRELASVIFEIGLRSKRSCDINNLLPVPNTVRNNVRADATTIRAKLMEICAILFRETSAGFTTDLWMDYIKNRSFMSLTLHYITEMFELRARTLQVKQVEGVSHTAVFLLNVFTEALLDFGIHDASRCVVVTDCGSNICGAEGIPSVYTWIPCANHKFATMITTVLCKTTSRENGVVSSPFYRYKDQAPEVFELLDRCKALVSYFKKSGLQKKLENTLKQENVTRWNSQLSLLESVLISFDEVTSLLAGRGKLVYINCIDKSLLTELVGFLRPFREITLKLEQWKAPTLHLVAHERHNIAALLTPRLQRTVFDKNICRALDGPLEIEDPRDVEVIPPDSNNLVVIKNLMILHSLLKWKLSLHHYMAALVDPRQKLRLGKFGVSKADIKKAKAALVTLMKKQVSVVLPMQECSLVLPRSCKKHKTSTTSFIVGAAELCSSDESDAEDVPRVNLDEQAEFDRYMSSTLDKKEKFNFDILQWWNNTGKVTYPKLAMVARTL